MADTGFLIDGRRYEVPALDTYTMDEAELLYECCGMTIEDLLLARDDEERAEKLKHPGLIRALLHIAFQRGNPEMRKRDVEKMIREMNAIDAMMMIDQAAASSLEEDDAGPPALTTEPEPSSLKSSDALNESSGTGSTSGSDEPDNDQSPTGPTRSDTSPTSGLTVLAG